MKRRTLPVHRIMTAPFLTALVLAALPPSRALAADGLYWYDGATRRPLAPDASATTKDTGSAAFVLRDAQGRPRTLPGGIIVTLRGEPSEGEARTALVARGLQPVRPVGAGHRTWLVASGPGLSSLELANRLHESGAFESVQPNWREERVRK